MKFETIDDIYTMNEGIRSRFISFVSELSDDTVKKVPAEGEWSIEQLLEHVSMVDEGMIRICSKLLGKAAAEGLTSNGEARVSQEFLEKSGAAATTKLKAPEFVVPSGEQTLAESIERLNENDSRLQEMRDTFKTVDASKHTFPHPYFGDINAHDWLVLRGGHEMRHLRQMGAILETLNGPK